LIKRWEIHNQLETGELPLLVGTHALIQDGVSFNRLGLVVIDEQHRFGVEQWARLQQKGEQPPFKGRELKKSQKACKIGVGRRQ